MGDNQPKTRMTPELLLPRPRTLRDFGSDRAIERLFIVRLIEYGDWNE